MKEIILHIEKVHINDLSYKIANIWCFGY